MGTIDTLLRVKADATQAVRGLSPLKATLEDTTDAAQDTERALKDLDKDHKIDLDNDAITKAHRDIRDLQDQMARDIELGVDTRTAQRRIRELRSAVKIIDAQRINLDVDIDTGGALAGLGVKMATAGAAAGTALGVATSAAFSVALTTGVAAGAIGAVVGAGLGIAGLQALKLADQMAQAKIAFTQFLGSGKRAETFLDRLSNFAAKTPFEFPELIAASKTLLAFGIDAGDIEGLLTTLGDAAALTGAEVENLTSIWGQMVAKGKVGNEELLQLTENGIPAYKLLSDAMDKPIAKIQDMATKGELLSDDVLPVLQNRLDATFGGGMAKQAETLSGKFSTFMDTVKGVGTSLGEAFSPAVSAALDNIAGKLQELGTWAKQNKEDIALGFTAATVAALNFGAGVVDVFATIGGVVGVFIGDVGNIITAIGLAMVALRGLPGIPDDFGQGAVDAGTNLREMGDDVQVAADGLHGFADTMRDTADQAEKSGAKMARGFRADDFRAKIEATKAELKTLGEKPPSPRVEARTEEAEKRLRHLKTRLDEVTRKDRLIKVNADIGEALHHRNRIKRALDNLSEKPQTIKVKAETKEWDAKFAKVKGNIEGLRDTRADIKGEAKTDDAKKDLEETAKPGGKARNAPMDAKVNETQLAKVTGQLDAAAAARTAHIQVVYDLPPALTLPSLSAVPRTVTPRALVGAAAQVMAGPTAAPYFAPTTGGTRTDTGTTTPSAHRELRPKTTPVAVYLDGVEIAHRIEARRGMAATTSVRRTA